MPMTHNMTKSEQQGKFETKADKRRKEFSELSTHVLLAKDALKERLKTGTGKLAETQASNRANKTFRKTLVKRKPMLKTKED